MEKINSYNLTNLSLKKSNNSKLIVTIYLVDFIKNINDLKKF